MTTAEMQYHMNAKFCVLEYQMLLASNVTDFSFFFLEWGSDMSVLKTCLPNFSNIPYIRGTRYEIMPNCVCNGPHQPTSA